MIAERSEEVKLAALLAGEPLHFLPENDPHERSVRSEWIVEVVRVGLPLDLDGAILVGPLDLEGRFIPGAWSMKRCRVDQLNLADVRFAKLADFSGCEFGAGLTLPRTRFDAEAAFDACVIIGALGVHDAAFALSSSWRGLHCTGDAEFISVAAGADLDFSAARFDGATKLDMVTAVGSVRFSGATLGADFRMDGGTIGGALHLGESKFGSDVRLHGIGVTGALVANGAIFSGPVSIDESRVGQLACSAATFGALTIVKDVRVAGDVTGLESVFRSDLDFAGVAVSGAVTFDGTRFEARTSFAGLDCGGELYCESAAFGAEADFSGMRLGGTFDCTRAAFASDAIAGNARCDSFVCSRAKFGGKLRAYGLRATSVALDHASVTSDADFSGASVDGAFDLESSSFSGDVTFANIVVRTEVIAAAASFARTASFAQVKSGGSWTLERAIFRGAANLRGANVGGALSCAAAEFAAEVNLSGARVAGKTNFTGARFTNEAHFGDIEFSADASFEKAVFSGAAVFTGARVKGKTSFAEASFKQALEADGLDIGDDATFAGCTFAGGARMAGIRLGGRSSFEGAMFGGPANFARLQSMRACTFDAAAFTGKADFGAARFISDASFRRARFFATLHFEGSAAMASLSFAGARLDDEATFTGARCSGPGSFEGVVFGRDAVFDGLRTSGTLSYARAVFEGDASFAGCDFARGADFTDARFSKRLNLERSEFPSIDVGGVGAFAAHQPGEASTVIALRGGQFAIVTSRPPQISGGSKARGAAGKQAAVSPRDLAEALYRRRVREGDAVHPTRQSPSTAAFWADALRVVGDRSIRWLTGYGVRPWRTVAIAIAAPALAFGLFLATPGDAPVCSRSMTPAAAANLTVDTYTSADRMLARPPRAPACGVAGTQISAIDVERINRLAGLIMLPLLLLTVTGVLRTLLGYRR